MSSFLTIHKNEKGPAFSTFDSIQAAKSHLQNLLRSQQVSSCDTLAIVRSSDDSIVYFRQRNNTIARLNDSLWQYETKLNQPMPSILQTLKEQLTFVFAACTNVLSRR